MRNAPALPGAAIMGPRGQVIFLAFLYKGKKKDLTLRARFSLVASASSTLCSARSMRRRQRSIAKTGLR
jgi:hypothetical protein